MANKIAIAGAGAMGSRIGTYLKQSGQDGISIMFSLNFYSFFIYSMNMIFPVIY
jgi:hypothetical protein